MLFNYFAGLKDHAVPVKPEKTEKSWNLEDEDSDEETHEEALKRKQIKAEEEAAEEDPLDAYMKEIYKKKSSGAAQAVSNKKLKSESIKTEPAEKKVAVVKEEPKQMEVSPQPTAAPEAQKKVFIMTGVAKKKDQVQNKGSYLKLKLYLI